MWSSTVEWHDSPSLGKELRKLTLGWSGEMVDQMSSTGVWGKVVLWSYESLPLS
jgi:hypothetical protein